MDCPALQDYLSSIYNWTDNVNMLFDCDKFERLRSWPRRERKPSYQYQSPDGTIIEEKAYLRDLGIEMDSTVISLSQSTSSRQSLLQTDSLVGAFKPSEGTVN